MSRICIANSTISDLIDGCYVNIYWYFPETFIFVFLWSLSSQMQSVFVGITHFIASKLYFCKEFVFLGRGGEW